jgi:hypothetical protein
MHSAIANAPQSRRVGRMAMAAGLDDADLASIAALVASATEAGGALVAVVDAARRVFVGRERVVRSSPLWPFCHELFESGLEVTSEGHAGVPVILPGVGIVGAVCAEGRTFRERDLASLRLAARLAAVRLTAIARERPPPLVAQPGGAEKLAVGDVVDEKFEITGALGEGGEATVYLARDRRLGQLVALKVQRYSADPAILREAKALAALHHPSIVQLYGWGQLPAGAVYLVLEYVDGVTLHRHLEDLRLLDERIAMPRVLEITRSIAGALATLHAAARLHGDVQPANIMIDRVLDRAVVIDFGLGTKIDGTTRACGGTPGWSAPEQLDLERGALASPALDAYGLACVAYDMLAGRRPFPGTRAVQLDAQRRGEFEPVRRFRSELPPEVDEVFERALAADPNERFPSAIAFADALEATSAARAGHHWHHTATEPQTHAHTFANIRNAVARIIGNTAEGKLFASQPPALRAVFDAARERGGLHPTSAYVDYIKAYSNGDLARVELLGRITAGLTVPEAFREMRVAHTPETLLHVSAELLHRYHDWGNVTVIRNGDASALVELEVPRAFAPTICHFLIAVLAGLIKGIGRKPVLREQCCVARGAGCCRYEVSWASVT